MPEMSRRELIAGSLAVGGALAAERARAAEQGRIVRKGRLKQSACRWCYKDIPLPDLAKAVADMGLTALDLVDEKDWPVLADHGLVCSMGWKTSPAA
jgi:hydroxypyruvate isomerase